MVLWMLAGCSGASGPAAVARTTPADHVLSLVVGKDCSIARSGRGFATCLDDEIVPPVRVHCYPTLGEATCYDAPDPFPGGQRKLGSALPDTARKDGGS